MGNDRNGKKKRGSKGNIKTVGTTTATKLSPSNQNLSILTKKKDKIKLKSVAFRSKLQATHESTKKQSGKTSKRLKAKKKKRHSLNFASFESTLEGLGERYGEASDSLRMKDVRVKSARQREKVMEEERGRMAAVLSHPVYRENPLKAVLGHLQATMGGPVAME